MEIQSLIPNHLSLRPSEPAAAHRGRQRGGGERVPLAGHARHDGGEHGALLRGHPRERRVGHDGGALHALVRGRKSRGFN